MIGPVAGVSVISPGNAISLLICAHHAPGDLLRSAFAATGVVHEP